MDPSKKYLDRCAQWHNRPIGMHYHTPAYNAFALSTLTYIAQLESPPPTTCADELSGLYLTIKGPGGIGPTRWASQHDLWRLKEDFGQHASCRSLAWLTEASHTRVFLTDPASDETSPYYSKQ